MIFWKEQLKNPCFFQPHRSYIVNMNHIISFDKTTLYTVTFTLAIGSSVTVLTVNKLIFNCCGIKLKR